MCGQYDAQTTNIFLVAPRPTRNGRYQYLHEHVIRIAGSLTFVNCNWSAHRLASLAYLCGNYVWRLSVVDATVPAIDRRRSMLETVMMGCMVTGIIASSMIALTLLLIVLNELK